MRMRFLASLFFISLILGCSSQTDSKEAKQNELAKNDKIKSVNYFEGFILEGDSIVIPSFEILVDLDENASNKLKAEKETVIVIADFRGQPKDTSLVEFQKLGLITFGSHEIELTDQRIARFENLKLHKSLIEELTDKNFEVLINIVSGRKSSENNLLRTEILQEKIKDIKGKQIKLAGELIDGPVSEKFE